MMTKSIREVHISPDDPNSLSEATSSHIDDSEEAILRVLEDLRLFSIRQLPRATHRAKVTV
jgi:hypothetical protein